VFRYVKGERLEFYKLKDKLTVGDYIIKDLQTSYELSEGGEFKGIQYYNIELKTGYGICWSMIPIKYRKDFYTSMMRINTKIPPHTDTSDKAVINIYVRPENCITEFYKFKTNKPKTKQITNQTNGYLFDENDLIVNSNFMAELNDVYVLDVTKPHSVIPQNNFKERIIIQLATSTYDFADVCNMLYETGNL
jgi:hypothetical protein